MPAPEGLVVYARAAKPSEGLKVIGAWVGMPMPGAEEVGNLVAGESIGNVLDLDQPIEFAMTLKGREQHGVISAAVKSLDDAKAAFAKYKLVPVAGQPGALRIDGLGSPGAGEKKDRDGDDDDNDAHVCELVPAVGSITRLMCGESDGSLHELAPWLSRTTPRTTFPADLHVEVHLAPVRPLIGQMRRALPMLASAGLGIRRSAAPELDALLTAAIDDFADFTSDADDMAFDVMLGEPQGSVAVSAQFRSTTSVMARLAVQHPERAAAPPASYWKLPADSDFATFHREIDAADYDHLRDHLADALGGALGKEGMADADRKAVHDVAAHTLDVFALPSVYGSGLDEGAASKAIAALHAVKEGDAAAHEAAQLAAAQKMAGWFVVGVDAPATKLTALEKEWQTTWARPGVAKWIHSKALEAPAPALRLTAVPKGLPAKDASHLELSVYPPRPAESANDKKATKRGPTKPITLHAIVVPDGGSSWLVFSADQDLAVAKAKELLAGSPGLASRAGLASMKDAKVSSGGFFSPRGLTEGNTFLWTLFPNSWRELGRDPLAPLAQSPDHGTTPILFQFVAQAPAAASPSGSFTGNVTVPKAAIEAIVRAAMHH